MEAEEIVKQLDMEQAVETPTSTATSTQELSATSNFNSSASQPPPLRPPHIPEVSPLAVKEELDADLPPLTGRWRQILPKFLAAAAISADADVVVGVVAPGSSPDMTYVEAPLAAVPPEASYEEDWEVFDP